MEPQAITTTDRPRMTADRLAGAAVTCMLAGTGLFVVLWLLNALVLDRYSYVTEDPVAVGFWVAIGSVYLLAPVCGILACVRLFGDRRNSAGAVDSSLRRQAGQRFGRAAMLFALTGLVAAYVLHGEREMFDPLILAYSLYAWFFVPPLLAVALGAVSLRRPAGSRGRVLKRAFATSAALIGLMTAIGPLAMTGSVYLIDTITYDAQSPTFAGNSDLLQRTVVVPTLDSPCPPNENVIWCSSFQLAWNELRDNVVHAPLEVTGAEEVAARLNGARQSASDLESSSCYAAAGRTTEGVVERIHKEMAAKFPSHRPPEFPDVQGILAYSYLTARVPFRYPFRQIDGEFAFTDSQGAATFIEGFGLWDAFSSAYKDVCAQIDILYYRQSEERNRPPEVRECAVDLCKHSQPYQVVVAMVPPQGSLADALAHVRTQQAEFERRDDYYEGARQFHETDVLLVPQMFWRTDHRFRELIGKTLVNAGMPIVGALQTIEFRLDRCGATLESESNLHAAALPRYFLFDRPFLVYMQKRGAAQPFFVMWVDNAELLTRK